MPARKSASIPEFASDLPHHVTRQVRQSVRLNGVAGDIMQAARELFETEGVAATPLRTRPACHAALCITTSPINRP